jgi:hypothetical protein
MNLDDLPIMFFIVFVLGAITQICLEETTGLLSLMLFILCLELYFLFIMWFTYEITKEVKQ